MPDNSLLDEISKFLRTSKATGICRPYGASPSDALGELFLRLSPRARQPIRNPSVWVSVNATGLLRNFLRAEYRRLHQVPEA